MRSPTRSAWIARVTGALVTMGTVATFQFAASNGAANAASLGDNSQGTLLFVGDSLTVGSVAFGRLQERLESTHLWTKVTIDAKVGRKAAQAVDVLATRIKGHTTAIVIALGVNDMISRPEPWYPSWVIKKVMNKTHGLPVLWVNPKFSPTGRRDWVSRAARFSRALRAAQAQWPTLRIADWNRTFAPSGVVRFISDGVHLTVSGYKYRARFCAEQTADFGRAIVASTTTTVPESTTTTTSSTTTTTSTHPPG